jgi:hypothetical protein
VTTNLPLTCLVAIALSFPSCVLVSHDSFPAPLMVEGGPRLERILVEGFDVGVTSAVGSATSTTIASVYGGGSWASGTSSTSTTLYENQKSGMIAGLSAEYLENIGLARVVERAGGDETGTPDLILRGSARQEGSWSNSWSIPLNTVLGLTLVMPVTWEVLDRFVRDVLDGGFADYQRVAKADSATPKKPRRRPNGK